MGPRGSYADFTYFQVDPDEYKSKKYQNWTTAQREVDLKYVHTFACGLGWHIFLILLNSPKRVTSASVNAQSLSYLAHFNYD